MENTETSRVFNYKSVFFALVVLAALWFNQSSNNGEGASAEISANDSVNLTSIDSSASPTKPSDQLVFNIPEPPPELKLQSALVKDLGSNFYFLQINNQQSWPLASLVKLLTAVVALENLDRSDEVLALVKRMMIISDNGAASQLAQSVGEEQFVQLMQAKALALGMEQTSIFDTTGLSFLNQSTIQDLEKLVDYIVKNHPEIFQFSRERTVVVDGRKLTNINEFVLQPNFMGGKTGYTDEASGNLVSIFQYQGRPILIIVLGTPDKEERFTQTQILFQWISKFYN